MPSIEVLVGMIASGKTTYARQRADAGALVVSHDDLTEMLHARYRYESELRGCYRRMEESIVWAVLNAGRDVIIDRTHLTRESRARWIQWAHQTYDSLNTYEGRGPITPVVAIVFPRASATVHACRRFESDPRGRSYADWLRVAEHHAAQAVADSGSATEGFTRIQYQGAEVPHA